MMLRFSLLFSLLCIVVLGSEKCPPGWQDKLDMCGKNLFFLGHHTKENRLPNTLTGMRNHCNQAKSSLRCIRDYARKCLDTLPKQALGMLRNGAIEQFNMICGNMVGRQKFIFHSECFNHNVDGLHACMNMYTENMQAAIKGKREEKLSLFCCDFFNFTHCVLDTLKNVGPPICKKDDVNFMEEILDKISVDVMDMTCGDVANKPEKCKAMMESLPPFTASKSKSIMRPFIELFRSM